MLLSLIACYTQLTVLVAGQIMLYRGISDGVIVYGTSCQCPATLVSVPQLATSAGTAPGSAVGIVQANTGTGAANSVDNVSTPSNGGADSSPVGGTIVSSSNVGGNQVIVYAIPSISIEISISVGVSVSNGVPITTTQTITTTATVTQTSTVTAPASGGGSVARISTTQASSSSFDFTNSTSSSVDVLALLRAASATQFCSSFLGYTQATVTDTDAATSIAVQTLTTILTSIVSGETTTVTTLTLTSITTSTDVSSVTSTSTSVSTITTTGTSGTSTIPITTVSSITPGTTPDDPTVIVAEKRQAPPNLSGIGPATISSACSQLIASPIPSTEFVTATTTTSSIYIAVQSYLTTTSSTTTIISTTETTTAVPTTVSTTVSTETATVPSTTTSIAAETSVSAADFPCDPSQRTSFGTVDVYSLFTCPNFVGVYCSPSEIDNYVGTDDCVAYGAYCNPTVNSPSNGGIGVVENDANDDDQDCVTSLDCPGSQFCNYFHGNAIGECTNFVPQNCLTLGTEDTEG